MICVLVFDSASVAVLERMLEEGRLPALAELRRRGRWHELETPARDFAAGAFYTLYSGVEVADHGIFYPFQFSPPDQRVRFAGSYEAPPAVWERLARAGLRTLAIDPYESRPPAAAAGVYVCGVGFTERVVLPRWSRPPRVGRELERRLGRAPEATEIFGRPTPRALLRLRERLVAAPRRVAEAAVEMLERERFDLVWLTFSAAHLAGHQFWDLSQLDGRRLDRSTRDLLAGSLEEVYAAVDAAIATVVSALPANSDVIVTSPVGMDVNTSRADLLPQMLSAVLADGAEGDPRTRSGANRPRTANGDAGSIWRLRAALPPGLRGAVTRALPAPLALEATARLELRGIDWSRTRAFAHPADNQGYVRLNVRGRERAGIVASSECEALWEQIEAGLRDFRDPDGEPAVATVSRVREHHDGRHGDRLPDLVVRWRQTASTSLSELRSPRFGTVVRHGAGSGRSGNHTEGGAWALLAPGASHHRDARRSPRLVDVAATVCELSGADPSGLVGEPLLGR